MLGQQISNGARNFGVNSTADYNPVENAFSRFRGEVEARVAHSDALRRNGCEEPEWSLRMEVASLESRSAGRKLSQVAYLRFVSLS